MVSKSDLFSLGLFIIVLGMMLLTFSSQSVFNLWIIAIPVIILGVAIIYFMKPIKRFFNDWSSHY